MADTSIEWTDITLLRVRATAAARVGITLAEYDAKRAAGEKWCTACKAWHDRAAFGVDRSRSDGLSAKCLASRVVAMRGPGAQERRIMKAQGLAWCRRCRAWLPVADVKVGLCRPHANEVYREYYAANAGVISRRHSARKRKLDPVPEWWRDHSFEQFGGLCAYACGRPASALDHVYPVNRGGRSRPENLVPACKPCNSSKSDNDPDPWILRGMQAFPLLWTDLIALNYERAGFLEVV